MKIEQRRLKTKDTGRKAARIRKEGPSFLNLLETAQETAEPLSLSKDHISEQDLKNLAAMIDEFGHNLAENPTVENFLRYKKYIKSFFEAIKENYEVRSTMSRRGFHSQKLYLTIHSVNDDISQLADMLLNREQNRLRAVKLVEHIKGLIIDLIL